MFIINYSHLSLFLISLDDVVVSDKRKPLALITNNGNRLRNNTLNNSNEASGSYSRLHLNTTPRPHPHPRPNDRLSNTPPSTPRSNNTRDNYTRFNDDDEFHSNTPNIFRSSTSFLSNDNDTRSTFRTSHNAEPILPAPFHNMANVHQICSWLCANPDILLLAFNMHLSMQTPVANAFNSISANFNLSSLATGMPKQEDKVSITLIYFVIIFVQLLTANNLFN